MTIEEAVCRSYPNAPSGKEVCDPCGTNLCPNTPYQSFADGFKFAYLEWDGKSVVRDIEVLWGDHLPESAEYLSERIKRNLDFYDGENLRFRIGEDRYSVDPHQLTCTPIN